MKTIFIKSLFWKLLERTSVQGIQFVIQIILARLLFPEEYGVIAIVMIFIQFANVFIQTGLNTALIQKKDSNNLDFSSVFYITIFVSILIYGLFYISAPIIAIYFNIQQLIDLFRVLSLTIIFGSINSIQIAFVSKNFMFRRLFFSSLIAVFFSGLIGIYLAYNNYGAWSLAVQQLSNVAMISIILWFSVKWRPSLEFSYQSIKKLFSYSWKLLVAGVLDSIYNEIGSFFIGKNYSKSSLGYYNRGKQFPSLIIVSLNDSIQSVMFPLLSNTQDKVDYMKIFIRRTIIISSYLIFPMMVGLSLISEKMVLILLTDKWLMAVPFIQIFSLSYALMPIHTANLQAINALGKSDLFLKLEVIKKIIGISIMFLTISHGIYNIAWGFVLGNFISVFINAYPNKNLISYGIFDQLKDVIPNILVSLLMYFPVYLVSQVNLNIYISLTLEILSGFTSYIFFSVVFKLEGFTYLFSNIKNLITLIKR